MQFKNCTRVAIIFLNSGIYWKLDETEINDLSKTIKCYFDLKANTSDCGNLVWFCLNFCIKKQECAAIIEVGKNYINRPFQMFN